MKNIRIKNTEKYKYLSPIKSLEDEYKKVQEVLKTIFQRFMNETNSKIYQDCLERLSEYRYISKEENLPEGRFVKYLNMNNPHKLKLSIGGYVVEDLNFKLILKSAIQDDDGNSKIFSVMKKNILIFMKIDNNDKMRLLCENF